MENEKLSLLLKMIVKKLKKKNISPILLIIISAVMGIAAYSF